MLLDTIPKQIPAVHREVPTVADSAAAWMTPGRFAALLGFLVAAAFPAVLLGSQTFVFRDYGLFGYPLAFFHRESFWRGELPLWNPLSHCGVPFLAQWNTMVLYPPSLIYLVLPLPWSLSFFCLVHLFWGGLGMYFLANNWTGHRLAGALAGVVFAFNGVMLSSLIWPSQIATYAWTPWVIWQVQQGWRRGGRQMIWGVVAGSMQMLAGGPETILLTWLVVFLLAAGDWALLKQLRSRVLLCFTGTVFLIALVCAVQLLPFMQLLLRSQRDAGFSSATWSMPTSGWANFLVPLFGMFRSSWGVYFESSQQWVSSYYTGIGTLMFTAVALLRVRDWRVLALGAMSLLAFFLAQGEHNALYRALLAHFPAVGFARFPVKLIVLISAMAPLLAAFGIKQWCQDPQKTARTGLLCASTLLVLIGVILVMALKSKENEWLVVAENGVGRAALLAGIFFLLIQYPKSGSRRQILVGLSMVMLFWADFLTHMPQQNPTASPLVYSPNWVNAGRNWKSEPRPGQSRAMVSLVAQKHFYEHSLSGVENNYLLYRLGLFMNCNLLEGIPQTQGFFALTPGEINFVTGAPWVWTTNDFSGLLDFLGVSETSSPAKPFEWEARPNAMPMITIGQKAVCTDERTAIAAFAETNIDFRKIVFLPAEAQDEVSAFSPITAQVLSTNFSNQTISIQTDAPAQTMVVIAQTYYPAWKAYVDGQPTKLWRANYAFQAVQVPAGCHRIELRYEDKVFLMGALLSGFGIAVCVSLWVFCHNRSSSCSKLAQIVPLPSSTN